MTILKTLLVVLLSFCCCTSILALMILLYGMFFPLSYNARLIGFVIKAFMYRRSKLNASVANSLNGGEFRLDAPPLQEISFLQTFTGISDYVEYILSIDTHITIRDGSLISFNMGNFYQYCFFRFIFSTYRISNHRFTSESNYEDQYKLWNLTPYNNPIETNFRTPDGLIKLLEMSIFSPLILKTIIVPDGTKIFRIDMTILESCEVKPGYEKLGGLVDFAIKEGNLQLVSCKCFETWTNGIESSTMKILSKEDLSNHERKEHIMQTIHTSIFTLQSIPYHGSIVHLNVTESLLVANNLYLSVDNPIRKLLRCIEHESLKLIEVASLILLSRKGLEIVSNFTADGCRQAISPSCVDISDHEWLISEPEESLSDVFKYTQQARIWYHTIENFVRKYLKVNMYDNNKFSEDENKWYKELSWTQGELGYEKLIKVCTQALYTNVFHETMSYNDLILNPLDGISTSIKKLPKDDFETIPMGDIINDCHQQIRAHSIATSTKINGYSIMHLDIYNIGNMEEKSLLCLKDFCSELRRLNTEWGNNGDYKLLLPSTVEFSPCF